MSESGAASSVSVKRAVYLVDDDAALRGELAELVAANDMTVREFANGRAFLDAAGDLDIGCVLLDYSMPGLTGLDVQRELAGRRIGHGIIMLTGRGDVGIAVRAMQSGAIDFLEKPFSPRGLLDALSAAFEQVERLNQARIEREAAIERVGRLTPRELQVLKAICDGKPNKIVAHELGISMRTVEVHRARLMARLEVRSLSDALRLLLAAGEIATA